MTADALAFPPLVAQEVQQEVRRRERLKEVYLQYYEPLCAFAAAHRSADASDAEDAVHSAFETLLTRHGELLDEAEDPVHRAWEVKSYLYSSVQGRVANQRRDSAVHTALLTERQGDPTIALLHPTNSGRPDWIVEGAELEQHVATALRRLTLRERQAIQLVYLRGRTQQGAATELEVTAATVQVLLRRAQAKLARILAPWRAPAEGERPRMSCIAEGDGFRKDAPLASGRTTGFGSRE